MQPLRNLLLFFILITSFCSAQTDSLNLVIEYLPEKTYTKEVKTLLYMEIRYTENKKSRNKPQIQQLNESTQYIMRTGSLSENQDLPFSLKMVNEKDPAISDIIFKGTYKKHGYPIITSVETSSLNKSQKEMFSKLIQESLKQNLLITKKLKTGDSFTTTIPFKYPGENFSEMILTTTYTLKEIKNGKAYFDYIQNYNLNMNISNTNAVGSGTGKGKFIYGITEQFTLFDIVESSLEVESIIDGKPVLLKMKVNTETRNTVL